MESFPARKYARIEAERMCTPPEKSLTPLTNIEGRRTHDVRVKGGLNG